MRGEQTPHARRYGAALLFVVLGTAVGAWHNRAANRGHTDVVTGAVRGVVAPPAGALERATRRVGEETSWLFRGRALATENERLRAQIAELQGENAKLTEAQIKYDQLKSDLGFVRQNSNAMIAADVIARQVDPKFATCLLNRGSRDGVQHNSVVVTRNGVVGQINEVTLTTASVVLLSDGNIGAGARIQRSRAEGICKGENGPELEIINLRSDADVKKGDRVVTSGMGGVYVPGLVIGTVTDVKADEGNLMKTAKVAPAVDFDAMEQVYILPPATPAVAVPPAPKTKATNSKSSAP